MHKLSSGVLVSGIHCKTKNHPGANEEVPANLVEHKINATNHYATTIMKQSTTKYMYILWDELY